MATKLSGYLSLSKIDKSRVKVFADGGKGIFINILQRKEPSEKGYTHYITMYDAQNGETIYLGNLKEENGHLSLTEKGIFISDAVIRELIYI